MRNTKKKQCKAVENVHYLNIVYKQKLVVRPLLQLLFIYFFLVLATVAHLKIHDCSGLCDCAICGPATNTEQRAAQLRSSNKVSYRNIYTQAYIFIYILHIHIYICNKNNKEHFVCLLVCCERQCNGNVFIF